MSQSSFSYWADWDKKTVRYFMVSKRYGSDKNDGYSDGYPDVDSAVKTLAAIVEKIPPHGNGRAAYLVIDSDDYVTGGANEKLLIDSLRGYKVFQIRTTGDNADAGVRAFDNSIADQVIQGATLVAGTNPTGYKMTITSAVINGASMPGGQGTTIRINLNAHGFSTGDMVLVAQVTGIPNAAGPWKITVVDANNFDLDGSIGKGTYQSGGTVKRWKVTTAEGGAPGWGNDEKTSGLMGQRIRWQNLTTLETSNNAIWAHGVDTLIPQTEFAVAPGVNDIFYIDEQTCYIDQVAIEGCQIGSRGFLSAGAAPTNGRIAITGVKCNRFDVNNNLGGGTIQWGFMRVLTSFACLRNYSIGITQIVTPPDGGLNGTRTIGGSFRTTLTGTFNAQVNAFMSLNFFYHLPSAVNNLVNVFYCGSGSAGLGSYSSTSVCFAGCGYGASVTDSGADVALAVGTDTFLTSRPLRITGKATSMSCGLAISGSNMGVFGAVIEDQGAGSCVNVSGLGSGVTFRTVVGSKGNTGVGLSVDENRSTSSVQRSIRNAMFCRNNQGERTMSVCGTVGDIAATRRGISGKRVIHNYSEFLRMEFEDSGGNYFSGNNSGEVQRMGPVTVLDNDAGGVVEAYRVVRLTANANSFTKAQADSAANIKAVVGVTLNESTSADVNKGAANVVTSGPVWVKFAATPTVGDMAYASAATSGLATNTSPAASGSNRKLRLGRVLKVDATDNTLALVNLQPDPIDVAADAAA